MPFKKKTCSRCHYLHRQYRDSSGSEHKFEVPQEHRKKAEQQDFSWVKKYESLGCYRGIWDEGHNFPPDMRFDILCNTKRNNCHFWGFQPGMFLPAAIELQIKSECKEDATRNYRLTIYGLILTIVGLVVAIVQMKL